MASSSKSPVSYSQDRDLLSKSQEFRNIRLDSKMRVVFEEMRQTRELCDITLVAGNVEIPAHKLVLAATSHYFRLMFTINFKEKDSDKIVIQDVNPEILTLLVEYSYTSKVMINWDNVQNLFVGS